MPEDTRTQPGPLALPGPWSMVAAGYSATTRQFLQTFSEAGLARLDFDHETQVIDIACGPGTTALHLAPFVSHITCVDFSTAMLDELRNAAASDGVANLEIREADGQDLPYEAGRFDVAVSMFGLMFFPDRQRGFSEIHRVLKPDGQALVSSWAPVDRSPLTQLVMAALQPEGASLPPPPRPSGLELRDTFSQEMISAGFSDVDIRAVTRALDVSSPEQFWQDTVAGIAPVALMKNSMSEDEWASVEALAVKRTAERLGSWPTTLTSTAWIATARK